MTVPTWANAGLKHNNGQAVATINNGLIEDPPIRERITQRAVTNIAVAKAAVAADKG
jgi:hypothetical protein